MRVIHRAAELRERIVLLVAIAICSGALVGVGVAEATGSGTPADPWLMEQGWNYYGITHSGYNIPLFDGDFSFHQNFFASADADYPSTSWFRVDSSTYSSGWSNPSDAVIFGPMVAEEEFVGSKEIYKAGNFDLFCAYVHGVNHHEDLDPYYETYNIGPTYPNSHTVRFTQRLYGGGECGDFNQGITRISIWKGAYE